MRSLERYELGDPADVVDAHRRKAEARRLQADWREAIRRQQNPEPKVDRYTEMYERLVLNRGKSACRS